MVAIASEVEALDPARPFLNVCADVRVVVGLDLDHIDYTSDEALSRRGVERFLLASPECRSRQVHGRLEAAQVLESERCLPAREHADDLRLGAVADRQGRRRWWDLRCRGGGTPGDQARQREGGDAPQAQP